MSAGLWEWALAAYARPQVEDVLLDLQDVNEQNVCLLLWAAWAAQTRRPLDDDSFDEAVDLARAWEDNAVRPLRTLRRTLKKGVPDMDAPARLAVREQIKAVELAAEQASLTALEAVPHAVAGKPHAVEAALIAAARAWGGPTPRPRLQILAELLSDAA
jgi:uncharacterized protein (TIGR02444 family)